MNENSSLFSTRCVCETQMPSLMANSIYGQGQKVKNVGTYRKVLSLEILMWYSKALALTVQKLLAWVKFPPKKGSNSKVKVTVSK